MFGPDSVAWRVIGHPVSLIGGLRALIIQSLHPLAMAGVAQHSDYRRRPLERLRRTSQYVAATTFGDRAQAEAAAAHVRRVPHDLKRLPLFVLQITFVMVPIRIAAFATMFHQGWSTRSAALSPLPVAREPSSEPAA